MELLMNEEVKKRLVAIIEKKPKFQSFGYFIQKNDADVFSFIDSAFSDTDNFSEKVYRIMHDIKQPPKCLHCGLNGVDFIDFSLGYCKCCSGLCSARFSGRKEKTLNTNIKRYGGKGPLCSIEVKNKVANTLMNRHGVTNAGQMRKGRIKIMERWYNDFITNDTRNGNTEPLFSLEQLLKTKSREKTFSFKCKKCESIFSTWLLNGHVPKCPNCNPPDSKSKMELDMILFIRKHYKGKISRASRRLLKNNKEIDVYLPQLNFAIEANGMYWHSERNGKDSTYHINKTMECLDKGILLYHFFESEWELKQDICKSMILNKVGCSERFFARKGNVRLISESDKKDFLNVNHIQGDDNSCICLGLFIEDALMSVMTFWKSNANDDGQWEMVRFCNKLNTTVVGGASKLLSYFERTYSPKLIVSYANRRYSNGNLYRKIGFELESIDPPEYFYIIGRRLEMMPKESFQKSNLQTVLKNFNPLLNEWENMKMNGWDRIWDCGNLVFNKKYTN